MIKKMLLSAFFSLTLTANFSIFKETEYMGLKTLGFQEAINNRKRNVRRKSYY
jgi:hypothetical protein